MVKQSEYAEQMPTAPSRVEKQAFLLLKEALSPSASARMRSGRDRRHDVVVELRGGRQIPLDFALWNRQEREQGRGCETVWILPRATASLRDLLRRRRENFVDLRGAVYLSLPDLLVDREGLSPPPRQSVMHKPVDPFSDRSSLVLRTLLEDRGAPERAWGVRELAEAADVGPATVTRVVREMQRFQVLSTRRVGRASEIRLRDPQGLFTLWTGAYDWTRNQSVALHAPMGDPLRFLRRARKVFRRHRWALTMQAGASLVAPHATWDRVHAYVDVERADELLEIAEAQGWPAAEDGRLVLMKPYYRTAVWHSMQSIQDIPVVSSLQLALDLWHYPLRGREQAEHIISTRRLLA